jgi:hypothetical protein
VKPSRFSSGSRNIIHQETISGKTLKVSMVESRRNNITKIEFKFITALKPSP